MIWADIPQTGELPPKEWRKHLDALLETGQLNPEIISYLDEEQRLVANEVKKSLTRIKEKYARMENMHTEQSL